MTATLKSDKVEVDRRQNGNRIEIASAFFRAQTPRPARLTTNCTFRPTPPSISVLQPVPCRRSASRETLTLEGTDAVVNVRNVDNGHVHVRTMGGPVTLTDVRNGHVEIESISGDVHLKSVTGPLVQAHSGSGKIFYDGDFARRRL